MSIFKAFQRDRKIGRTPFSLNSQNILTANFGGLTPISSIPVLPNDKIKLGTNILTKVEPMPAPAFTRIKQNQYSFFVPNEQIWQHWNDFVSNGTAYSDTYGNNSNNQQTDNLWRIPQIPSNQLQLISKIAYGWAIPVFRNVNLPALIVRMLEPHLSDGEVKFLLHNWSSTNNSQLAVWQVILAKCRNLNLLPQWFISQIPYWEFATNPSADSSTFSTDREKLYYMAHQSVVEFGCSLVVSTLVWEFMKYLDNENSEKYIVDSDNLENVNQIITNPCYVAVRVFCDNISLDTKKEISPFSVDYNSGSFEGLSNGSFNKAINYVVYGKNKYQDLIENADTSSYNGSIFVHYNRQIRKCGYFWSTDCYKVAGQPAANVSTTYFPYMLNNHSFNPLSVNPDCDLMSFLGYSSVSDVVSDDIFLTHRNFKNYINEMLYDVTLSGYGSKPNLGSWQSFGLGGSSGNSNDVTPFVLRETSIASTQNNMQGLENSNPSNLPIRSFSNYFDTEFPLLFCDVKNWGYFSSSFLYSLPEYFIFDYESYNLGYDLWSFCVYQCKNTTKLLDYYNIPIEGLCCRSFDFYSGEFIKALPFMAYSKVYNDYFRNKVVTSAELDYKEVNSVSCIDYATQSYIRNLVFIHGVSRERFPKWLQDAINTETNFMNGWCIPFSCAPKNAMDNTILTLANNTINIRDMQHFHDIRLTSWWSAFNLLTGWQLQALAMHQIVNFYSIKDKTLYGIIADKLYLPSYYNGLLHYKYQNFNKDYFSSALLDPMSGANQEDIGNTVNTLINAEAKQGFWNRLAQNRSVTQFWQSVFGCTPSHNDYDKPLLLGSVHTDVNVGEVVQLSQTDTTPQGQRSGLGSAHDSKGLFQHAFNEHGYVLTLLSFTLELQYMQGLEKDWTPEESFLDLPFIDFVGLGNQSINQRELNWTPKPVLNPSTTSDSSNVSGSYNWSQSFPYFVLNKVSYVFPGSPKLLSGRSFVNTVNSNVQINLANGSGQNLTDVWGYIPRYSTWKFKFDQVHGEFRSQLDFWHSFRKFFTQPILCHEFCNWEFMSTNDELMRMFFVTDDSTDKFKVNAFINVTGIRPLPYVCTPKTSI